MLIKAKKIVVVIDITLVKSLVNLLIKVENDVCERIIGAAIELVVEKGSWYTLIHRYITSRNDVGMYGVLLDSIIEEVYQKLYSDITNLIPDYLSYCNCWVNVSGKLAEIHIESKEEDEH